MRIKNKRVTDGAFYEESIDNVKVGTVHLLNKALITAEIKTAKLNPSIAFAMISAARSVTVQ